jgi:NADPH-dependent 2,4-dienoyl-CoA reductase/sulfur reductase-like enzyme
MSDNATVFDVLVVGAGPGGIAAAVTAAEAGRRVALIDEAPFAGGQIWRNRGERAKAALARHWLDRLNVCKKSILWHRQSRVVAKLDSSSLLIESPAGPRVMRWKSLVLATGARELFLPFPGWTLPGVVGAGGIQALMKQGLDVRGKRVVIAGTGPLLLAVADLLRSNGAIVPVILEQAPASRINRFAFSLVRSPSKLLTGITLRARLLGTLYSTESYPLHVSAIPAGLQLEYRRGTRRQSVDCDYLACGFNLIPNNELPQSLGCQIIGGGFVRVDHQLRTSVPEIYAIGELTGIGGVEKAILEGQICAHSAMGNDAAVLALAKDHAASLDFTDRLATAFSLRKELRGLAKPDTIVCRCEDVPLKAVEKSINGRDAKLQTRCGMGPCQGRICGPILQQLLGAEPMQVRPPIFPVAIGTLSTGTAEKSQ